MVSDRVTQFGTVPDAADRALLQTSLASNAGCRRCFGPDPPHRHGRRLHRLAAGGVVDAHRRDVGAARQHQALRGEEDAGRWELLLAGQHHPAGAPPSSAIAGLGAGLPAMLADHGSSSSPSAAASRCALSVTRASSYFAVTRSSAAPAMFLAVGALTSQLAATRRRAAGLAAACSASPS